MKSKMVNPASDEDEGKGDPTPSAADNKDTTPHTEQGQAVMRSIQDKQDDAQKMTTIENKELRPISITEKDFNWILKINAEKLRKASNREDEED